MPVVARDVMEPNVLTIPATLQFREVQRLLVQSGCYGAPVIDEAGRVVGVVSAMDLLRAADQALDDELDPGEGDVPNLDALVASDLATPEAIWVAPDAPVARIAQLMDAECIHRVLVGIDGKLEGIVSAIDLVRLLR